MIYLPSRASELELSNPKVDLSPESLSVRVQGGFTGRKPRVNTVVKSDVNFPSHTMRLGKPPP